jgi:hypothetical protein
MPTNDLSASELTIVFGGDTSLGDAYLGKLKDRQYHDRLNYNPLSFFEALEPLITDKDHFVINLETVLANNPKTYFAEKRYCGWDMPERTIKSLKHIGVNIASLANNHTLDYGPDNLMETISHLEAAGIGVTGAGINIERAAEPWKIHSILGNIYLFAAFEFRREYHERFEFYASRDSPGVNSFRLEQYSQLSKAILSVRHSDPTAFIIAFPHWGGTLNYGPPTKGMWDTNEGLLEAGVDLVLGHGSHNVQRCFASRNGTTVFSLGNFVFNSPGRYKLLNALPYSFIGRLHLKYSHGQWTQTLKLYPIISDNLETGFLSRPVTETEVLEVFSFLSMEGKYNTDLGFELQRDDRGWHIVRTMTLPRRLSSGSHALDYA